MTTATKWGSEFLVNTTTKGIQYEPDVTALADGRFVVTWGDTSNGANVDVRARVFDAHGLQAVPEFRVAGASGQQYEAHMAALADGGFVAVWSDTANGSDVDVRARIFKADGTQAAADFLVASNAAG